MLVGDEDGIELSGVFTDGGKALDDLPAAQACIDENSRAICPYECGVTRAGRREHAYLDDLGNSSVLSKPRWASMR